MKLKLFELTLRAADPRPLDLNVKAYLFRVSSCNISLVQPKLVRDFTEEDYVDFDSEVASNLGLSVNDLLHGEAYVKTIEYDIEEGERYMRVFVVENQLRREKYAHFKVFTVHTGKVVVDYTDDRYAEESEKQRLDKVSRSLSCKSAKLLQTLRESGIEVFRQ